MTPLPYLAHGLVLSLAWFLAINLAVCALVTAAGALLVRADAPRSASFWIALRLLPSVAAAAFVALFFVPSYWKYEPLEFVEGFDLTLTLTAVAAFVVIASAAARGATAWRGAVRRADGWMRHARPLSIPGAALPAFAIDIDQPIIALVGVLRPRLLVTRGLIDALTRQELEAAVAHEVGHLRAMDNLKRLLMRAAPDVLAVSRISRDIERRWASAAEHLADRIGGDDDAARCALASALVKVARLTPPLLPAAEPISALISGDDIASRVRTLLDDRHSAAIDPSPRPARWAAVSTGVAAAALAYPPLLRIIHDITEIVVHSLP